MALKANCIRLFKKGRGSLKTLLIMKFLAFFLLVATFGVSARDFAQGITISQKNVPIQTVFKEIEHQTSYRFFYNENLLQESIKVSVDVRNVSLLEALDACFKELPLTYSVIEKTIVVKAKKKELQIVQVPNAGDDPKTMDVKGKVTDEAGAPVEGVTVTAKAKTSSKQTMTNRQGEFEIASVEINSTLHFSSIGYEPQMMPVVNGTTFAVKMKTAVKGLDQAVVIAYGQTSQRLATGSVSKITSEEIQSQPVSNPLAALEGRVPGLFVTQTSGIPGGAFNLQIRGQNTLPLPNPNSIVTPLDNPLFIIDGVPFAPQNSNVNQLTSLASPGALSLINPYGGLSPFSNINPNDIESIEVLRDADATAIYGSRGANGVILITTKKGKSGKTKLNISLTTGQNQVPHTLPMMNTLQYIAMRREAYKNDGLTPTTANAPDIYTFDTTRYTDFKNYFIGNTSRSTDLNASLMGGSANTSFMLGAGYHKETYIYPGDFSDNQASFLANFHHSSADKRLVVDFSSNYSYHTNNSSGSPNVLTSFILMPDYPAIMDSAGNLIWNYKGLDLSTNPLQYLKKKYKALSYNLLAHLQLEYEILPSLFLRSSFGYNTFNINEISLNPIISQDPVKNPTGSSSFATNDYKSWIIEPQLEYRKPIHDSKLDILIGSTFQENSNSQTIVNGSKYFNDALLNSITAAGSITASSGFSQYKYNAIFARINYDIQNKYIINLNGRRDGSSRFGPNNQFGNFGSVGAAWIFSEESFFKRNFSKLSFGKLRISYGTTGSDAIGNYQYLPNWGLTGLSYQGVSGYYPLNLYKPDFSWTVNKKLEAGLELGFFKDRLLAFLSWYQNRCGNQLISYQLPIQTGFSSVTRNFDALIQNSGWEIQLKSSNISSKNVNWTTSFNLTIPKNKLLAFPGIESSSYANTYIVGQPLSVLNKFIYDGVNPNTGIFQFKSSKGDTSAPTAYVDYNIIGNLDPKFYGGIRNSFSYKQFQIDVFFEFVKQLGVNYLQQVYNNGAIGQISNNQPAALLGRWQQPGDIAEFQKFTTRTSGLIGTAARAFVSSSGVYSDASFIRMKTVSVSYSLRGDYLKKIKVENCRIYVNMQNLLTFTNYKGNDPEVQGIYNLPPLRAITAGLSLSF